MKKIFTFILTAILALNAAVNSQASPADPTPYKYTQPNGSVIILQGHGDEFYHWITDEAGNEVEIGEDGYVHKVERPLSSQEKRIASAKSPMRTNLSSAPQYAQSTGSPHFLILLIQFQGEQEKFIEDDPGQAFSNMLNLTGYNVHSAKGSVQEYFSDNSAGKFTPIFDVYGPVTVSGTLAEYGKKTAKDSDNDVARALIEACYKLKDEINWGLYDANNDKTVDNVFFFYAGNSEAENTSISNNIWPHKWNVYSSLSAGGHLYDEIPGSSPKINYIEATTYATSGALNGYKLSTYGCTSEFTGSTKVMCGIGTFCHEFSHTIGLPDYYDTDYDDNGQGDGLFHYSLMSSGNYNGYDSGTGTKGHIPPSYTAIDKVKMGWASWDSLTSGSSYTLDGTSAINNEGNIIAYRTILSSSGTNEYFVYEARNGQKWDSPLSTGLLIYHVRESRFDSYGNTYENNPGIYLKAAYPSSLNPPHASEANVPYPGPYNVTSFDNNSPSPATDWSGTWHGDEISNIKYDSSKHQVTFTYTKKNPDGKTLSGKVTDYSTGAGISGASIKVDYVGGSKSTTTSTDGSYSLDFGSVSNPNFSISISKSGYLSLENDSYTHPGGDVIRNFTLISESAAEDGIDLRRCSENPTNRTNYTSNSKDTQGAIKFSASEMAPFVGMKITDISFRYNTSSPTEVKAIVYFDEERVLNQTVGSPKSGVFNDVKVSEEIIIPLGKNVYVGYSIKGAGDYPYSVDKDKTENNGFYEAEIGSTSWHNYSQYGSLLISFKVQDESKVEHDTMYILGYSGLNLVPGETYTKPKNSWSSATTIDLSMAESSDPVKSATYYFDDIKQSGASISITSKTSTGDHTIKAEVTYESGKTETIIQVIKVQ